MNNSQIVALQQGELQKLVDCANRNEYDWIPMVELTTNRYSAKTIAEHLLKIYFEVASLLFRDDVEIVPKVSDYMSTLGAVYEAFAKMEQSEGLKTKLNLVLQEK